MTTIAGVFLLLASMAGAAFALCVLVAVLGVIYMACMKLGGFEEPYWLGPFQALIIGLGFGAAGLVFFGIAMLVRAVAERM